MPQPIPDELQQWVDEHITGKDVTTVTEEMQRNHPLRPPGWDLPEGHPDKYQPKFNRQSLTHRVLATITDEEHYEGKSLNTLDEISRFLASDNVVPQVQHQQVFEDPNDPGKLVATPPPHVTVKTELDKLEEASFVGRREDGSYFLTRDGWVELIN